MSWKPSIPVLHLLFFCLLAGDLGSHIFVNANAIDCNYGWTAAEPTDSGQIPYSCSHTEDLTYTCSQCGRHDRLLPSAKDCINEATGKVMNGGGPWACDLVLDVLSEHRKDGRQLVCNQKATSDLYYCKSRNRPQQCPETKCCLPGKCH